MTVDWRNRVRELLVERGLTMKAASRRAGRGDTFVRDILERGQTPSAANLEALARVLQTNVSDLFGREESYSPEKRRIIPIIGHVGAGGEIDADFEQVREQFELPETAAIATSMVDDPIGFRVKGNSMYPRFKDGETLIIDRKRSFGLDAILYNEVVCVTHDGHRCVKRLMPGSRRGVYTLESIDPSCPPIRDVAIRWASPVQVIIPNIGISSMTAGDS
jgi:phage repressor protein C with HTH and peptisase S24 domain